MAINNDIRIRDGAARRPADARVVGSRFRGSNLTSSISACTLFSKAIKPLLEITRVAYWRLRESRRTAESRANTASGVSGVRGVAAMLQHQGVAEKTAECNEFVRAEISACIRNFHRHCQRGNSVLLSALHVEGRQKRG